MKKNKYLLLVSSVGVLGLLLMAAVDENYFKQWRRIQAAGRMEEEPIAVQLRQVVNPGLRVADRCVSCHVAMAPGEGTVTGAKVLKRHPAVVHDPTEYGCTVCHAGQGSATEMADAHGDVHFWPAPMVPARMSYAGCGTCHAPLGVPEAEQMQQARLAFERLDCLACHREENRGGTVRPGGGGMEGPDLSRIGIAGYKAGWYEHHVAQREKAAAGPWKNSFAEISGTDQKLLEVYLRTRMAASRLVEAKAVFHGAGCLGCHKVSGVGGDEGPDLSRAGEKDPGQVNLAASTEHTLTGWIKEHFRSPQSVTAGSQMPAMGMGEEEIEQLTFYVLSLRRREMPAGYTPRDRVKAARFGEREFAGDGKTIYGAFCSGCHGDRGEGRRAPGMAAFPAIGNVDFLSLVSEEALRTHIRKGRPGRRMPGWGEKDGGLKEAEIEAVAVYLRDVSLAPYAGDSKPARWAQGDVETGRALYASACAGCHGAKGEGVEGPALRNKALLETATDTFLVETIGKGRRGTGMGGFRTPSSIRRMLTESEIESIVTYLRTWQGGKS